MNQCIERRNARPKLQNLKIKQKKAPPDVPSGAFSFV